MKFDNLGDRMKDYEYVSRNYLTKRIPVIIRLDGKAFHGFTKGMKRPFDEILIQTMQETAKYLCENIMCCKIAYTQSDEISLLLVDYETPATQQWFDNNIQKMVSVSASMATLEFNKRFVQNVSQFATDDTTNVYTSKYYTALFDSRVFSLPKEEVNNYFIWRQQDATRNSIQMVAQSLFSHKELQCKNCNELQEKMWQEKNVNWNDFETVQKRGACVVKENYHNGETLRTRWIVDKKIPIFTQDREYIDKYVFI